MRLCQWAKSLSWIIFPTVIISVLMGCGEPSYDLGDIESEIDACQWAIVHYAAEKLEISPEKESMETIIERLEDHSERWARDAGLFLDTLELADKKVEEAMIAQHNGQDRLAGNHIDSAIWLLRSALKEAERLGFNPTLGCIYSPDSRIGRGIQEEEQREEKTLLPAGDSPWGPFYMDRQTPPVGYLIEGYLNITTYLEITIWRLQLAKDHLV